MTIYNVKALARENTIAKEEKKKKEQAEKEVTITYRNGRKQINRIVDINKQFILEFYAYSDDETKEWIIKRTRELLEEKGSRKYFAAFRSEFARKFLPHLCKEKQSRNTKSMLDLFDEIDRNDKK